jgi:hypothetical protein
MGSKTWLFTGKRPDLRCARYLVSDCELRPSSESLRTWSVTVDFRKSKFTFGLGRILPAMDDDGSLAWARQTVFWMPPTRLGGQSSALARHSTSSDGIGLGANMCENVDFSQKVYGHGWHAPVCHSIQRGTSQVRGSQVKFLSKLSP